MANGVPASAFFETGGRTRALTMKDPRYAYNFFHGGGRSFGGGKKIGYPKEKYMYYVFFEINPNLKENPLFANDDYFAKFQSPYPGDFSISFIAQNVTLPSVNFDADKLNQYNKWRLTYKKRSYDPMTISFMDTADDKFVEFVTRYMQYYIYDAPRPDPNSRNFVNGLYRQNDIYGEEMRGIGDEANLGIKANLEKYFFTRIVVYHFAAGLSTAFQLINPMITKIQLDSNEYRSQGDPMLHQVTFDFENLVWLEIGANANFSPNAGLAQQTADRAHLTSHGQQPYRPIIQNGIVEEYGPLNDIQNNVNETNRMRALAQASRRASIGEFEARVQANEAGLGRTVSESIANARNQDFANNNILQNALSSSNGLGP